jgi:hypothetical protein
VGKGIVASRGCRIFFISIFAQAINSGSNKKTGAPKNASYSLYD